MPRAYASGIVAAPVEKVWSLLREFNALPSWHSGIGSSDIVEGTDGVCGCVRTLGLGGDSSVSERLLALDDHTRTTTYTFTDPGPFAVRNYVATVHALPVTTDGSTFVEWYADFEAAAEDEQQLTETFAGGVFAGGIADVAAHFA